MYMLWFQFPILVSSYGFTIEAFGLWDSFWLWPKCVILLLWALIVSLMLIVIWMSSVSVINLFLREWVISPQSIPQPGGPGMLQGSRDGAVVRALASHQCGPGSIPGPGVICGLSLLLVLVLAPRVFLRVLQFSSLHKNQHFQIPIRSGIRGPQVCLSRDCYVLPSLNIVDLFIYLM